MAVLLVVFNHVGIRHFWGGYVGVDVFFVISGYLISSLLLKQIGSGTFSLKRFYARRYRRIVPALIVMLTVTSVAAYIYFFPLELKGFAQSELGAIFSVSNIVLWKQAGYFDGPARLKPLLHTWSLGVEEQFYIVFPLVLMAICRWGRSRLKTIVWALTIALFLLAWYWTGVAQSAAFYLAPLRAWEFLFGTLLALKAVPTLDESWKRNLGAGAGLLLILAANVRFQETTKFPGFAALWPCLGAALIIAAGETGTSVVGELLAWAPVRWIGLISYSLYLWHWPIQVFQTTDSLLVPERYPLWASQVAVILVSVAVAAISWRFVEQPFRTGRLRSGNIALFAMTGTVTVCLVWFSGMIVRHDGWSLPGVPMSPALAEFAGANPSVEALRWQSCYMEPYDFPGSFKPSVCLADDPHRKQYLLLGDSHAAAMYWGLKEEFPELNISQLNASACVPTIRHPAWEIPDCKRVSDFIYGDYLLHHPVDTVVLIGRWWQEDDIANIGETVDWIRQHGMKVVLIGPSIEFDRSLVRLLEVSHREHDPDALRRHRVPLPQQVDRRMAAMARDQWKVPYISMYDDLCTLPINPTAGGVETASGCPVYGAPGIPLIWDTDHLSPAGAILFAKAMRAHNQLP